MAKKRRRGNRLKLDELTLSPEQRAAVLAQLGHRGELQEEPAEAEPAKASAPARPTPGKMNKTEQAYAQVLEHRKRMGEVVWYAFERVRLKLAERTYYVPDFVVLLATGQLEVHEVKGGFWRDDARAKTKIAADRFPFRFLAVTPRRQRDGGGWAVEVFPGRGGPA